MADDEKNGKPDKSKISQSLLEELEKGRQMRDRGDREEAARYFSESADEHLDAVAAFLNELGITERGLGNYDKALVCYEKAFDIAIGGEQKALALVNRADIFRVRDKNTSSARISLERAQTFAAPETYAYARVANQLGLVFYLEKRFASATSAHENAKIVCESLLQSEPDDKEFQREYSRAMANLGSDYEALGDTQNLDMASGTFLSSLKFSERLGYLDGIFNAVIGLGRICQKRGDVEKAIEQYERAEEVVQRTGYKRGETALALHMADAYFAKVEDEKAKPYLETLINGVLDGNLTEHDLGLEVFKNMFSRVAAAYDKAKMDMDGFDYLRKKFEAA